MIAIYTIIIPLVIIISAIYSYFILKQSIGVSILISIGTSGLMTAITLPALF
jgi:hypothetical protein